MLGLEDRGGRLTESVRVLESTLDDGATRSGLIFISIFDRQQRNCGFKDPNVGPDFLRQKSQPFTSFGCETGNVVRIRGGAR
jgi:hypothetical protein